MKITKENVVLFLIGIFFIAFGIFAMDYSIYTRHLGWVLWLCYVGMIIIGLGCLTKNSLLILSQLNLIAVPLIFWMIDFCCHYFFKYNFWSITQYFFDDMTLPARIISIEHFFLVPLALAALYLVKIKNKKAWMLSLGQMVLFFILTRLFTESQDNVNCAFNSCLPYFASDAYHPIRWFSIGIALIFIVNFTLYSLPFFKPRE